MKLTSLLLATALLWASHVPASGQSVSNITQTRQGLAYNAASKIVATNYLVQNDDHTVLVDATAGAVTISLPSVSNKGYPYRVFKKIDATANAVTVDGYGSQTIDGATTVSLGSQYQMIILHASASGWHILNGGGLLRGDTVLSSDSTGGNLGAANTLTAGLNLALPIFATMTNGSTETSVYTDDPPAAEWGAVGGTADPTDTQDATFARVGTNSLKLAWLATAVAGDGVKATITSDDLEANASIGMWIHTSEALAAGDLTLVLTDDGGARTFNIPAVASANVWTWVEVDITGLTGGTGDAITEVAIKLSSAGDTAHAAMTTYVDFMVKWGAADELALGVDVLDQPGSVRGIVTMVKADAGTTAHTPAVLTEHTDFFIHRESGSDFLVQMTDQSSKCGWGIVLHK